MNELEAWIKEVGERIYQAKYGHIRPYPGNVDYTDPPVKSEDTYSQVSMTKNQIDFWNSVKTDLPKALKIIERMSKALVDRRHAMIHDGWCESREDRCECYYGESLKALEDCARIAKGEEVK